MIHNLTPKRMRLYITYTVDFIPDTAQGGEVDQAGAPDLDGRPERQPLPGLRHPQGHGQQGQVHLPEPAEGRLPARACRRTSGPWTATACWWPPPVTCTPAACGPTCGSTRPGARYAGPALRQARHRFEPSQVPQGVADACAATRPISSSPSAKYFEPARPGVLGRRDDRRRPTTGAWPSRRATRSRSPRPTRPSCAVLVRVDGDHGRLHGRGRRGQEPVQARRSTTRARSRTATSRRTASTAARRPSCPTRASSLRASSPAGR